MRGLCRIERLHGRDPMRHFPIVDEAASKGAVSVNCPSIVAAGAVDGRDAARDVLAVDQEHEHVVDAVAVEPLGSRASGFVGPCFDSELVDLDVPRRRGPARAGRTSARQNARIVVMLPPEATTSSIGSNQRAIPPFSGL